MGRRTKFFVGRMHKPDDITWPDFLHLTQNSKTLNETLKKWAITDLSTFVSERGESFWHGHLTCYDSSGQVSVVDEDARKHASAPQPNLILASAPFVFLPDEAAIAYAPGIGRFSESLFRAKFCQVLGATRNSPLDEFEINVISDVRSFIERLGTVVEVTSIGVELLPPNPLYSVYWKPLFEYLSQRRLRKLRLEERVRKGESIPTELKSLKLPALSPKAWEGEDDDKIVADSLQEEPTNQPNQTVGPSKVSSQTDAALLMAADGYGDGTVSGLDMRRKPITIHTRSSAMTVMVPSPPAPQQINANVRMKLREAGVQRNWKHGKLVE